MGRESGGGHKRSPAEQLHLVHISRKRMMSARYFLRAELAVETLRTGLEMPCGIYRDADEDVDLRQMLDEGRRLVRTG